jgi:hypothetical protein
MSRKTSNRLHKNEVFMLSSSIDAISYKKESSQCQISALLIKASEWDRGLHLWMQKEIDHL